MTLARSVLNPHRTLDVTFPEEQEETPPTQRSPDMAHLALPDLTGRVATMILYEQSPEEIHHHLINQVKMTEGDAYMTYMGAKLIAQERASGALFTKVMAERDPGQAGK